MISATTATTCAPAAGNRCALPDVLNSARPARNGPGWGNRNVVGGGTRSDTG